LSGELNVRATSDLWSYLVLMEQRILWMKDAITPFTLAVPQADLEDLTGRVDQTR
jgi:hypothetical protein